MMCHENKTVSWRVSYFDGSAGTIVTTAEAVSSASVVAVAAVAFTVMVGLSGTLGGAVYIPFCDTVPHVDSAQPWPETLH
jgi:hypothetical protein